jgi:translation initiation factor eIF-2B subunit alpha/methylthioribose-1-phosphate isomerase
MDGISFKVYVDETRPRLQGMLTAWELLQEWIDHEIIVDNAAGFFMQQGKINLVLTGADRVLRDGSVANKIGTLEKAVLAKFYQIPFYICMPWTTYDPDLESPEDIPIEFRNPDEVTSVQRGTTPQRIAPVGSSASNPAFDITPADLITGYLTRDGIFTHEELHENYLKWLSG